MANRRLVALALAATMLLLAAAAHADKKPPAQPININTATAEELTRLPGIGPAVAAAIVHHREHNGAFRRVEELLIVRGISRARLRAIRPYIRVQ